MKGNEYVFPFLGAGLLMMIFFVLAAPVQSADRLQNLASWDETRTASKRLNAPIVLLVEQRHCGFCQRLKREVFRPMANDSNYVDRVIFASVLIDYDGPLIEVDGEMLSGFEFAETFDANTTPTVLFLDHSSNELQHRMVGYVSGAQYNKNFISKLENSIESIANNK
jgi:thioredoxin-related protein